MNYNASPRSSRAQVREDCMHEFHQGNLEAAQVLATLSVEEALCDLAATIARAADKIATALR
jgi:hypothetical protein